MRAELNDLEKEMGEMIARKRYDLNRKNNTKDLAVLGKAFNNSIDADIEGLWAELAFCKVEKYIQMKSLGWGIHQNVKVEM